MKAGEVKDIPVGFPTEYHAPDLAGKTATFTITAHKVEEEAEAKIDDELGKRMGFENLNELKDAAKTQIQKEFDDVARDRVKRDLFDYLAEEFDFALPPGLVDAEFEGVMQQYQAAKERGNLDPSEAAMSEDDMKVKIREIAERRVRLGLVVAEIGIQNKVDVTDDEMRRAIMSEAARFQGQESKVLEYFRHNPQAIANIRAPILEGKVLDYVLEVANVTEKPVTKDELFAPADSESKGEKKTAKSKKDDSSDDKPKKTKSKK
jgi:trigger factor